MKKIIQYWCFFKGKLSYRCIGNEGPVQKTKKKAWMWISWAQPNATVQRPESPGSDSFEQVYKIHFQSITVHMCDRQRHLAGRPAGRCRLYFGRYCISIESQGI